MRRIVSVLVAAGVATGIALVSAPPALAVGACDSGAFCAYHLNDLNPSGSHFEYQGASGAWPGGVWNDENSVKNNGTSGMRVRVYDYNWYIDTHYCVYMGHSLNLPSNKDEDGQSHKWLSGLTGCY